MRKVFLLVPQLSVLCKFCINLENKKQCLLGLRCSNSRAFNMDEGGSFFIRENRSKCSNRS